MTGENAQLSAWLVSQCPDGIVFADKQGRVELWNAAAERIFGWSQQQAMGQSLDMIIPDKLRESHWRGFNRAVQAGQTRHQGAALPTKALRADGEIIYVEMSFGVVLADDDGVVGAVAQVRDITERFQKERAQRKRLRELELRLPDTQL